VRMISPDGVPRQVKTRVPRQPNNPVSVRVVGMGGTDGEAEAEAQNCRMAIAAGRKHRGIRRTVLGVGLGACARPETNRKR
jgi:hypothetical protein